MSVWLQSSSLLYLIILLTVRTLEKAKATGNYAAESSEALERGYPRESESDTSDSEQTRSSARKTKKLKVSVLW